MLHENLSFVCLFGFPVYLCYYNTACAIRKALFYLPALPFLSFRPRIPSSADARHKIPTDRTFPSSGRSPPNQTQEMPYKIPQKQSPRKNAYSGTGFAPLFFRKRPPIRQGSTYQIKIPARITSVDRRLVKQNHPQKKKHAAARRQLINRLPANLAPFPFCFFCCSFGCFSTGSLRISFP